MAEQIVVSMPPQGRKTGGWHLPGYNYCGPFTNLRSNKTPTNKIDECCKRHDYDYSNGDITTKEADENFIDCIQKAGGHKLIENIFAAKGAIDRRTGYASDRLFRGGVQSTMGGGQKRIRTQKDIARLRKIGRYYKQDQTHRQDEEIDEEENDMPEQEQGDGMDATDGGAGTFGAGGTGGSSNGGGGHAPDAEPERPIGQASRKFTLTFKKSFSSYCNNGINGHTDTMAWSQHVGAMAKETYVRWNEGWQIIPWGIARAAISRHEWDMLMLRARRFRFKSHSVEIEGLIPFQHILNSSGVSTSTVAFTNKPNVHVYVDDAHLLPAGLWGNGEVEHNDFFSAYQLPYGQSKLKSPIFKLYNVDTRKWSMKDRAIPPENRPQQILSLYNTGKVHTLYPGQHFQRTYHVMNGGWRAGRGTFDFNQDVKSYPDADWWRQASALAQGRDTMVESVTNNTISYGINNLDSVWFNIGAESNEGKESNKNSWYRDTNISLPARAPPYILMKSETYYDPQDNAMDFFHQFHVHYETTVEIEELDMYGHDFDPTYYEFMTASANSKVTDDRISAACMVGPCDNIIGQVRTNNQDGGTLIYT